jgi:hypothetical protein
MAATLVLGTFAVTTTKSSTAFAYMRDQYIMIKKTRDGSGNGNGNTIIIQKCKQIAIQSGWDNDQEQECENLICTHPGAGATCVSEAAVVSNQTGGGATSDACLTCFTQRLNGTEQTNFVNVAAD